MKKKCRVETETEGLFGRVDWRPLCLLIPVPTSGVVGYTRFLWAGVLGDDDDSDEWIPLYVHLTRLLYMLYTRHYCIYKGLGVAVNNQV